MSPLNAPSTQAMDDNSFSFLDDDHDFGFSPYLVSQGGNFSKKAVHKQIRPQKVCEDRSTALYAGEVESTPSQYPRQTFEPAQVGVDIPDFVSDRGTPNSTTSSLITPTQPFSTFTFPPVYEYQFPDPVPSQPFPSKTGWFPSDNPSQIPFSIPSCLHPPPYQSTWHTIPYANNGYAHHSLAPPITMPHCNNVYGGVPTLPHPTFHAGEGMYHPLVNEPWSGHSKVQHASDCNPQDDPKFVSGNLDGEYHRLPKGKAKGQYILVFQDERCLTATIAGPKRVERPRKRAAPYRVDKDHEGARNKNCKSKQAFLSETPGYENVGQHDKAPKSTTKR